MVITSHFYHIVNQIYNNFFNIVFDSIPGLL